MSMLPVAAAGDTSVHVLVPVQYLYALVSSERCRSKPCKQGTLQHNGRRVSSSGKSRQCREHKKDCCNVDNVVRIKLLANAKVQPAGHTELRKRL